MGDSERNQLVVDDDRRARAEVRRREVALHKTRLGDTERDFTPVSGPAAVSLVAALTRQAWSLSGQPLPSYPRAEIPVRFVPFDRP